MSDQESSSTSEWHLEGPVGAAAVDDMLKTLGEAGLSVPQVPSSLEHMVLTTRDGWAWGTDISYEPMTAYFGLESDGLETLTGVLAPSHEDFWMWAHRGHGMNSYGAGIVARLGPIVIVQQTGFGGVYMDGDVTLARLSAANDAWNETLDSVQRIDGPPRVAVLWSDYRGWATIVVSSEVTTNVPKHDSDDFAFDLPEGWRTLLSGTSDFVITQLENLFADEDDAVAIAADHLDTLIRSLVDNESKGLEMGLDNDESDMDSENLQMTFDDEKDLDVDVDDAIVSDDQLIGVEHLVEAILERTHDRWTDYGYLCDFISLVREEFGLAKEPGRLEDDFDMVLEQLSGSVLPFQGAMEAPEEIAAGYRAANRGNALDDLLLRLREAHERFLFAFLRTWRPDVDTYFTTMGDLRRRGLREPRHFDPDDW